MSAIKEKVNKIEKELKRNSLSRHLNLKLING